MFLALELTATLDLSQYSRLLWQQKLSHQILENGDQLLVLVARPDQVTAARELFRQWQSGELRPNDNDSISLGGFGQSASLKFAVRSALVQAPLTLLLIIVCSVLWLVAPLDGDTRLGAALLYPDFSLGTGTIILSRVWQSLSVLQVLRLVTPILLHGGLLHLLFNMTWLWELGRRIERVQSAASFALAILVIAVFSNTIQYLYGGGNNFGGMSGVIYGLFAYIWCWQLFDPRKGLALPGALILYMVGSLLLFTWLGLDMIANAAHMGGFLTGMAYGALVALASRLLRARRGDSA